MDNSRNYCFFRSNTYYTNLSGKSKPIFYIHSILWSIFQLFCSFFGSLVFVKGVAYLNRCFQEFFFHSKINFIASIFLHIKVKILNKYKIYIYIYIYIFSIISFPATAAWSYPCLKTVDMISQHWRDWKKNSKRLLKSELVAIIWSMEIKCCQKKKWRTFENFQFFFAT